MDEGSAVDVRQCLVGKVDPGRAAAVNLAPSAVISVDRAIAAIAARGLRYEVGPLEPTIQGPFEAAWEAAKAAPLACIEAGAPPVVTFIKVADGAAGGMTIEEKTAKYRA